MIRKTLTFVIVSSIILFGYVHRVHSPEIVAPERALVDTVTDGEEDEIFTNELIPPKTQNTLQAPVYEKVVCTTDCPLIVP